VSAVIGAVRMLREQSLEPPRTAVVEASSSSWNEDPINGCQIGTKCPIPHAKQYHSVSYWF
jgi:hypothetical protein